jgi:pyridinium-3,5-biscarboxylic acid mononucleotide sulfurtransferase
MLQPNLKKVIENIIIKNNKLPTIAVSGGIDSLTLAAYTSHIFKNRKIKISHAVGPAVPIEATNRVKELAYKFNWDLKIINTNEIFDSRYTSNPINRCFFCKENLYSTIKSYSKGTIFSGANIDDVSDYRPGLIAAKEANVKHPFILAKIGKNKIRKLALDLGLGKLSKIPSSPCLASRVQTGIPITPTILKKIDVIERFIKKIIYNADIRCRLMKDNLIIQFNNPKLDQINDKQKSLILEKVKSIFLIKRSKISFSEYKRGSAFIKNNEKIKT